MAIIKQDSVLNRPIALSNVFWIIIVLFLVVGNVFFGVRYFLERQDCQEAKRALAQQDVNRKVLEFTDLFVDKVLRAEGEVDFNARLKLENTVRNLNDDDILQQWQLFVESKDEDQAQKEVKTLLALLIEKMKIK